MSYAEFKKARDDAIKKNYNQEKARRLEEKKKRQEYRQQIEKKRMEYILNKNYTPQTRKVKTKTGDN